jgi:predicted glycosyltransferase
MDVLSVHQSSDVRAVFVPYDTEGQTEQARRAALLDKAGYAINLPQSQLNPESLLAAMKQALILPKVESQVNFSGAEHTAKLIKSFIKTQSTAP